MFPRYLGQGPIPLMFVRTGRDVVFKAISSSELETPYTYNLFRLIRHHFQLHQEISFHPQSWNIKKRIEGPVGNITPDTIVRSFGCWRDTIIFFEAMYVNAGTKNIKILPTFPLGYPKIFTAAYFELNANANPIV